MAISLEAYEIPKEGTLKKDLKWVPQYETLENGSHRLMVVLCQDLAQNKMRYFSQ
jgi:hypothetical protein